MLRSIRRDSYKRKVLSYKYRRLFKRAYRLLDVSPLKDGGDCGLLCGRKCCRPLEELGIYLMPHERNALYGSKDTFRWERQKRGYFLQCDGICDRKSRPMQCRVYPLMPIIGLNGLMFIRNPMGGCPIDKNDLTPEFIRRCFKAYKLILKNSRLLRFYYRK